MSKYNEYIAHVQQQDDTWLDPHLLETHLQDVAKLAKEFAAEIGIEWAELAGRWHDLGKYWEKFQYYIREKSGYERENAHVEIEEQHRKSPPRVTHSTAGAIYAIEKLGPFYGHVLAYIIAGHHAGLPDWYEGKGGLGYRLNNSLDEFQGATKENIPANILAAELPSVPAVAHSSERIALWIRMLFSCLVDADFLDTEKYMRPDIIRPDCPDLAILQKRFEQNMNKLKAQSTDSPLAKLRHHILTDCLKAASWQPGMFSLTVPTGGGKTLSSLAFALQHALKYNKRRIIYAIPFTSIIEQNADVFREFVGAENVLEHHSNLDVAPDKENNRARLATENWNAPLIVTTNVQLFESLHASRTSRCRKLHNLINSVIILDEAQQIPRDFHAPITQVMQQMSDYFGVTWVLCTATQPVLTKDKDTFGQILLNGLENVREMMPIPANLVSQLERVKIQLPKINAPRISWPTLSGQIKAEACVLVVVNTRRHARALYDLVADKDSVHLSANMCAEHRTAIIKEIKARLKQRLIEDKPRPLRVVSTQLIDTGVDVDFPVVYRAMAGLDSIAQSAGRCNRENKLGRLGKVIVFKPEQPAPPGFLRQGEEITLELISDGQLTDPLAPESFKSYFSLLNRRDSRDKHNILKLLKAQQSGDVPLAIAFRTAAEKFRLIDNVGVAIVVPYIPSEDKKRDERKSPIDAWVSMLEEDPSQKWIYKKLQRYTVTVPEKFAKALQAADCIELRAGLFVLKGIYHQEFGVDTPDDLLSVE